MYPFKRSEHHQIHISEQKKKHCSCTIYPTWILLRSYIIFKRPFIMESVCHILQWAGKGGLWRGCKVDPAVVQSIHPIRQCTEHPCRPVISLCWSRHVGFWREITRSCSKSVYCCLHIQSEADQPKWPGRPSHEWAMTVEPLLSTHTSQFTCGCVVLQPTQQHGLRGSFPKWLFNVTESQLILKEWVSKRILWKDVPPYY